MAPYNLEIPKGPFTTLVADPPWPFKDRLPGPRRGAAKHYACMDIEDIEAMRRPLLGGAYCQGCGYGGRDGEIEFGCEGSGVRHVPPAVADNAHLYLWTPNAFIHDAWEVAQVWGFEPKTVLTWVKVTRVAAEVIMGNYRREEMSRTPSGWEQFNSKGVVRFGMGHGYRGGTEHVIVAKRGKLDYLRKDAPNVFFAPRRGHSEKPEIFYDIVESMSPGPRLELFATRERPGWTCLVPPKGESHDNG